MTKYGYKVSDWELAKEEIRSFLIERAKARQPIAYSDLAARVETIHFEPRSYAFASMLGEISTEEDDFGRGMLSVMVVYKGDDLKPGPGFFKLAKERGYDVSDQIDFWIHELDRVSRYWNRVES
jgi:hypothetical protein